MRIDVNGARPFFDVEGSKLVLTSTQAKLDPARCAAVFERLGGPAARDAALEMLTKRFDLDP